MLLEKIIEFLNNFRNERYSDYLQSSRWEELRRIALERSNYKCDFCGEPYKAVHHISYPKRYKQDHVDNLLVVCGKCHGKLHGIRVGESLKNEESLFSEDLPGGGRTYFFEIRYADTGKKYLSISEAWKKGTRRIIVFEGDLQAFITEFSKTLKVLKKAITAKETNQALFSAKLSVVQRAYFFDMQYTVEGAVYLTITESTRKAKNSFERQNIMIFEEDLDAFSNTLNKTMTVFERS